MRPSVNITGMLDLDESDLGATAQTRSVSFTLRGGYLCPRL